MAQYLSKEGADNLSSAIRAYIDSTHSTSLLKSQLGAANGVAPLDSNKLIPSSYLPAYVDDVLEYDDYDSLPSTGVSGKIYVTLDNGKTYRWGGTTYVEISASLTIGEDASTAFAGNRGVALEGYFSNGIAKQAAKVSNKLTVGSKTYDGSSAVEIVKSDIGLGNVLNTAFYERKVMVNGTEYKMAGTSNSAAYTIFAPTTAGTSGQVLKSNGSGVEWTNQSSLSVGSASKLTTARKLWGRSFDGSRDIDDGIDIKSYINLRDSARTGVTELLMDTDGLHVQAVSLSTGQGKKIIINENGGNVQVGNTSERATLAIGGTLHSDGNITGGADITASGNVVGMSGVSAKGIADFSISGGGSATGGAYYSLESSSNDSTISLNLKSQDGSGDSSVILPSFSTSRSGIVPKAASAAQILFGGGWGVLSATHIPNLSWSKITSDKPTTLAGYGITDAKIVNGVITLGSNTITPIVSGDLKTLTFAAGSFTAGSYSPTTAKTINIPTTTAHISEDGNLYFTNARARAAITGGASTIVTSGLTASRALISNANGKVAVSDITSTELSYLDGVSSNIQTQLNAKFPTANFTKANIKSTLGISDWALATSKPSYSASDISNLSLSVDTAYDWDTGDDIDAQNYGYSLTVGSKSFAMSAMTKTEVDAIISKYFS